MNVADKSRKGEKITPEDVQRVLDNTDWRLYGEMVTWKLNYPKSCNCNNCGRFQNWKKWGETIYKKHPNEYKEITTEIEEAEERRGLSRKINGFLRKNYSNSLTSFSYKF